MEDDVNRKIEQSTEPKSKRCSLPYLVVLVSIPIFFFINKLLWGYCFGRTSLIYSDYESWINPVVLLIETAFLVFLLWLSKRRWYQFSLRTLLIFVTLFAISCSWFAVKLQQARRQREAVEKIRKWSDYVEIIYSWQVGAKYPNKTTHSRMVEIICRR